MSDSAAEFVEQDLVYDVLVRVCGARDSDDERRAFASQFPACREYRFQGDLGFGGKVYFTPRRIYVGCYPEHRTPERAAMIERANRMLAPLTTGFSLEDLSHIDLPGRRAAAREINGPAEPTEHPVNPFGVGEPT